MRQTAEEGQRTYRPKRCGNNNKDEDNSPKTLNDRNYTMSLVPVCSQMIGIKSRVNKDNTIQKE